MYLLGCARGGRRPTDKYWRHARARACCLRPSAEAKWRWTNEPAGTQTRRHQLALPRQALDKQPKPRYIHHHT